MAELTKKEEPKEQLFTLSFTRDEILDRIRQLSQSENVTLYSKVQKGAQEYDELQKLMQLIEPYLKK
jgi:DNA-binding MltR family transcriptional regulator